MKIKIITNDFDEKFTIDSEECHKAYYLNNNQEKRGVFTNGVAISGKDIKHIAPDYNATMGWNPSHRKNDDDWNEIRKKGVDKKMSLILEKAVLIAKMAESNPLLLQVPLSEAILSLPQGANQKAILGFIDDVSEKFRINLP